MNKYLFIITLVAILLPSVLSADEGRKATANVPIRTWTVAFVDSETDKPLMGIQIDAQVAIPEESEKHFEILVTNEDGQIKIPLRQGDATFLNVRGPGWCYGKGLPIVGEWLKEGNDGIHLQDPRKTITLKLHRGTDVKGRLLNPDGSPAAGVSFRAAANCSHEPWINTEFKMNSSYSTEYFADWQGRTTTAVDGSFNITVPPKFARNWLHLGTTGGDFQAIDTELLEQSSKNHPLVRYAPLEIDVNHENRHAFDESNNVIDLGDIRFSHGIVLRGRVIDGDDKPLAGVRLLTSSAHGPIAGRKTTSRTDGTFEFLPMNPGSFRLRAELHDSAGREVRESLDVKLRDGVPVQELIVKFEPQN